MNKKANSILPENPTQAARELIKFSEALLVLAERETQVLVQNDLVSFSILQDERVLLTERYTKASEEFRSRLEEFRSLDKNVIDKMEDIQRRLGEKTHANNAIVSKMYQSSETKTQATLFTVQEAALQKPLRFQKSQEERG